VQPVINLGMFPSPAGLSKNNTNQKPISQMVLKRACSMMGKRRNFIAKTAVCKIYPQILRVLALRLD